MYRTTTGLASCLAAAALAGCATAPAAGQPTQAPGTTATSVGAPAGCLRTTTITNAGNGKIYCFRVGQKLDVFLRGTLASRWQEPQVSGNILRGVPNGALSLVAGLTGASYRAVRPGRAVLTSVRLPCPSGGSCAPDHRFRAVIVVLRLFLVWTGSSSAARAERTVVDMDNQAETTRATEGS
ncbi:MAG: hypothetical protein ACRDOU_13005 [Streptosporangiaceae bacterium]